MQQRMQVHRRRGRPAGTDTADEHRRQTPQMNTRHRASRPLLSVVTPQATRAITRGTRREYLHHQTRQPHLYQGEDQYRSFAIVS